jgi:hypothetical protein
MTSQPSTKFAAAALIVAAIYLMATPRLATALQQQRPLIPSDAPAPHRTRLILKDGSYQVVMSYRVDGNVVHYISAERGGAQEEIPASLIDFEATRRWETAHTAPPDGAPAQAPVLSPELLKEEAERASLTPEVVPDLHLPEDDSVLALDYFHGTPELVPLAQSQGDLNRNTAHNLVRAVINPLSSAHQILQLKGEASLFQLHIDTPVLYLRVGDTPPPPAGGPPLIVDTHGAGGNAPTAPAGGSPDSRYVVVRTDVRTGIRVVSSFKLNLLGGARRQEDVVETATELLPGGHWMKITPHDRLEFGEYALMEVISDHEVNLGVWDFGIHPVAPDNPDALKPQPRRSPSLERRRPIPN